MVSFVRFCPPTGSPTRTDPELLQGAYTPGGAFGCSGDKFFVIGLHRMGDFACNPGEQRDRGTVTTGKKTDDDIDRLVERVADSDRDALEGLFRSEAGRLLTVARRIVRRRDLAEEVVQEAFVLVWQRAGQFDPGRGHGRAWLSRIVRNRALNLIRDGARMDHLDPETLEAIENRDADAHRAYESLPERHALKVCLEQLDAPKRRSILLCYVTGMSHGEVAAKLGAPLGTIKAWIRRGVSALKECMG